MTLHLISCVSQKAAQPAPAGELYVSDWFRKARAYVESTGSPWLILSAKYGLVPPSQVIDPYEATLNAMTARQREVWGCMVVDALGWHLPMNGEVTILAGEHYRRAILDCWLFKSRGYRATVPMEGLGIGEQKAWLVRKVPGPSQLQLWC